MQGMMGLMYGFVLFLAGSAFSWGQGALSPVHATLCDLYEHPEQYAGKMVKVRGGSVSDLGIENLLHDAPAEPCPTYMRLVVVFPSQVKPAPAFQIVQDGSYKKLVDSLHYPGPIHIDATYEGRFDPVFVWRDQKRIRLSQDEKEKGYGKKHQYDGRIVLHQVSDVWALPLPHR